MNVRALVLTLVIIFSVGILVLIVKIFPMIGWVIYMPILIMILIYNIYKISELVIEGYDKKKSQEN